MKTINIGNFSINHDSKPYFVADIAANHDGSIERAYKLIELAKEAGADATKFQNFTAEKIVSDKGFNSLGSKFSHQKQWTKSVTEVYKDASVPHSWTPLLKKKCDEVGIEYFTSPYDIDAVNAVDPYVRAYKIGSGDITWNDIIINIAKRGKPLMLATGASSIEDVKRAVSLILQYNNDLILMQCNTNYTADIENLKFINLNVLKLYQELFPDLILGLSDHTPGYLTVLGALALGARVIEKHFTDDKKRSGPDHKFSMSPADWKEMVDRSNDLLQSLGDGVKRVEQNESETYIIQRRALRTTRKISKGEKINKSDLFPTRPCLPDGIPPYDIGKILGKSTLKDLEKDDMLTYSDLE